jgi:hypothetical protein
MAGQADTALGRQTRPRAGRHCITGRHGTQIPQADTVSRLKDKEKYRKQFTQFK